MTKTGTRNNATKFWIRAMEAIKTLEERPDLTLPVLVQELGIHYGAAPALLGEQGDLSYRDLARRTAHYAAWASSIGLAAGEVVGLLMRNCPEYVAIWLGISQTGAAVALLNSNLTGTALLHCISAAGCRHIITEDALIPAISPIMDKLPETTGHWTRGNCPDARFRNIDIALAVAPSTRRPPGQKALALLIFTSGTTGLPKAARVTHGRVLEWSFWFAGMMAASSSDRLYNCLPMYHSTGGVVAIGAMLVSGGSVVIRKRFSARRFWADIAETECTIFQYIGELCRYLVLGAPDPNEAMHRLRLCCGNGMRPDVWPAFEARFGVPRILEFYAATEGNVSLYNCEGRPGAIGRVPAFLSHRFPVALVKCDIATGEILRDERGRMIRCAVGEAGEAIGKIQGSAESQFDGYTDEKSSAAKVIHDVFESGDRWFRTGDLMRKDGAGFYYFVDRIGDSFRWKGENVSTTEIAELLTGCPGVLQAVVYGVEVPGNEGKAGMAAMTTNGEFSLPMLHAYLQQHVASYARPVFLRVCKALEATGTFKQPKEALRREGYRDSAAGDAIWVFDPAADSFVPCDERQIDLIDKGGIGSRSMAVLPG